MGIIWQKQGQQKYKNMLINKPLTKESINQNDAFFTILCSYGI